MAPTAWLSHLYRESGLRSVYATGSDAWLLIIARCCRMFAYGSSSLILALFFAELHVSDEHIGLFMTLTLAGDVVLSLLLTLVADKVGRRRTLAGGSVLMILSGATFALCENYWALLLAAVLGVISATGGDFGPFRAIEESTVSELTTPNTRADVLVWYVTMSSLGSAAGTACSGWAIEWLQERRSWTLLETYHATFWLYVLMGTTNLLATLLLSSKCELKKEAAVPADPTVEAEPFLGQSGSDDGDDDAVAESKTPVKRGTRWISQISTQTLRVVLALWFLLMVDSLADGMVNMSLTTYYMDQKFHISKSSLGNMLSVAYLLASCSTIFAGPLARHIGLVNTMVFTHIPSSTGVLLFAVPQSVGLTFALLLLRIGLNNMDQAPRAALIAAVVKPEERTAVMGITGMLRTLASTVGPTVTGILSGSDRFWIAFVVAGSLRLAYDIGLFAMFINIELYKHEPNKPAPEEPPERIGLQQIPRTSDEEARR